MCFVGRSRMVGTHDVGEARSSAKEAQDLRAAVFQPGDILLHGENLGMLQAALLLSLHYSSA